MIVDNGKYYLYRHIRLDTNKPFYVGVGTKHRKSRDYRRAESFKNRNKIWQSIYNRTSIEVEILLESNDVNFIAEKEKEFIGLHGRICKNNGSLANLDFGGYKDNRPSAESCVRNKEMRKAQCLEMAIRTKGKRKHGIKTMRQVFVYACRGYFMFGFESIIHCAEFLGVPSKSFLIERKIDSGKIYLGYFFCSYPKDKIDTSGFNFKKIDNEKFHPKGVVKLNDAGDVIKEYKTIKDAATDNDLNKDALSKALRNTNRKRKFLYRYK